MRRPAPFKAGDHARVLHSCTTHGTGLGTFPIQRVTPLNDGTYRLHLTRCDGSPMEVTVDKRGHDVNDYVSIVKREVSA